MSERAAPFYCPYCGDEDIEPFGESHGEWRCRSCLRVWKLAYLGSTGVEREVSDS
jgi:ribosomal protein L37AE/L43A